MYQSAKALSGLGSTAAGIAILPNTGGNPALIVLSIATITVGGAITASFVITRLAHLLSR